MAEVRDRTFTNGEHVQTDGTDFVECHFESASLRYAGGAPPTFTDCRFGAIGWHFEDAALRTIQLLQGIKAGGGEAMVDGLFAPGNFIGE